MCAANLKVTNNRETERFMVMGPNNGKHNDITKDHKEAQRMREKTTGWVNKISLNLIRSR